MTAPRRIVQGLVLVTSIGLAGWLVASASAKPPATATATSPDAGANTNVDAGTPRKKRAYLPATKAPGRFAMEDDEGSADLLGPASLDGGPAGETRSGQTQQKRAP